MARRTLLLVLVLAVVWLAVPFQAAGNAQYIFQTDMAGGDNVPPFTTIAWGFVRFFFSDDRLEADYTVDVKGISTTLVQGADLHRGPPGSNGPVVRHLADGGFIVTAGKLRLTPEELAEFVSGAYYVSLRTKDHPEGEIRGQVIVPGDFLPAPPTSASAPQPQPASQPVRAPAPGEATIRPPNTGEGGLIPQSGGLHRAALAGIAAVIIGVGLIFVSGFSRDS